MPHYSNTWQYAIVRGDAAASFSASLIQSNCGDEPSSIHDRIRTGTRFDFFIIGDGGGDDGNYLVSYSDRDLDLGEENDDTAAARSVSSGTVLYGVLWCMVWYGMLYGLGYF